MKEDFQIEYEFNVHPSKIYDAWLDSKSHQEMTGGGASIKPIIGSDFETWDAYIQGTIVELHENHKIIQTWRTTEFDELDEDSELEIELKEKGDGCLLILRHSHIPKGQGESYKKGWFEHYFEPMEFYFDGA
tara:strand:- start:2414 stop:2809 length:396 start_codon:yes stop_codon:yes gene_type:complete